MTQGYAPIKLNENTPEPTADGIYLLTITVGYETRTYPATKEGDLWLTDGDCTWKDLLSEMSQADRVTIQSLAAHDAQIRADALSLTDEETNKLSEVLWNYVEDVDLDAATGEVKSTLETIAKTRMEQKQ